MGRALGDSLSVEMVDCPGVVAVIGSPKANGGRRRPRALHTTLPRTLYRMANLTFADALGVSGDPASDGGRTRIWLNPQLPPAQGR